MMGPLTKRVALLASVAAIILFFLSGQSVLAVLGVLAGTVLSLHKIRVYRRILTNAAGQGKKGVGLAAGMGIFQLLFPLLFLWVAIMADFWLFIGAAAGLLACVMMILINIVTEKIGLTHNDWAGWF